MDQLQRLLASLFRHHGPRGILASNWPTGSKAIWLAVVLAVSLLLYFA